MSKFLIGALAVVIAITVIAFVLMGVIISFNHRVITFDNTITAQVNDMKVNYNKYFNQIKEASQVPKAQVAKLKEIYDVIVSGRKAEGELARLITEANLQIDQSTFIELQRIIVSGRNEIYMIQKVHIDTVREYNTYIAVFPNNIINAIFKHAKEKQPTMPIASNVQDVFDNNEDKPMEVF